MSIKSLKKFSYISFECDGRVLNGTVFNHLFIDVRWDRLEKDKLICKSYLIMRVYIAKKVQKNARVTERAATNCRRKKAPVLVLLHLKERIARNLCAVLVKEEMLP
jgi:hypothetical protein